MKRKQRLLSLLLMISLMAMSLVTVGAESGQPGSPSQAGISARFIADPDNSDPCGTGWHSLKLEANQINSGNTLTFQHGALEVTVKVTNGTYLEWSANLPVQIVAVKGGPVANHYDYGASGRTSDTNLHAPVNSASGKYYEISYIAFCYYTPPKILVPILECITDNGDGTRTAYWGYANFSAQSQSARESFLTGNAVGGTTTPPVDGFLPGRHISAFYTIYEGDSLSWTLTGSDGVTTVIIANEHSPLCVGEEPLRPILECVENLGNGNYRVWWGYKNDNPFVLEAQLSTFSGQVIGETAVPPAGGFLPGRHYKVFSTVFSTATTPELVWTLKGPNGETRTATASSTSQPCTPQEPLLLESLCRGTGHLKEIDWIITNPNDVHLLVDWEVEGQTGQHTAPPGISSFTTVKVSGSPNTMTLYFEGKVMAMVARACYEPMMLEALCSPNPASRVTWKITNPNDYAVDVLWKILLSDPKQQGTVTVQANSEFTFTTATIEDDPNIAMLFVDGVLQRDAIAASFVTCPTDGEEPVEQEIITNPEIPSLPGGEITLDIVEEFEQKPDPPAQGNLPATDGLISQLPYLSGLLLMAAGMMIRKKEKLRRH
jgi:hypothetical protein